MSSAYSDDGQIRARTRERVADQLVEPNNQEQIALERFNSAIDEPDTGVSVTAELSEGRRFRRER